MPDREKVINELNDCLENQHILFMDGVGDIYAVSEETIRNTLTLLKEHVDEKKRIMKVIWDTLHEGLSIDTVADQDWVYEQIRRRIEDT